MASNAPGALPLLYSQLEALSSSQHAGWKGRASTTITQLKGVHAIPLTVEEFPMAQRHYPIVFSVGDESVPLALMGLNEGVNVFIDDEGMPTVQDLYIPAYARRYPWLLAKLNPQADELSLCFDPTSGLIGQFDEGMDLFDGTVPSESTKAVLGFCEQFEIAGQRTNQFVKDLDAAKLLIDGELTLQPEGATQPYIYRGFRMVSEEALNNVRGDQARKMVQNGMMGALYAHLFSLGMARDIFDRQMKLGQVPSQALPQ